MLSFSIRPSLNSEGFFLESLRRRNRFVVISVNILVKDSNEFSHPNPSDLDLMHAKPT
jgi:hypothetical protein